MKRRIKNSSPIQAPVTKPLSSLSSRLDELSAMITSDALRINKEGDLLVRRNDQLANDWHLVRLGTNLLPTTGIELAPRTFAEETEVMATIVLVADRALRMSTGESNQQHRTIALAVATLCKLWEHLWINGVYSLRNAHPQHFITLTETLATEGWGAALRLRERTKELLDSRGMRDEWFELNSGVLSIKESFRRAARTCAFGKELRDVRETFAVHLKIEMAPRKREKSSVSLLRQWFTTINVLHYIDERFALAFEPIPEVKRRADFLGRPGARTKNLEIDAAVDLLVESFKWINERSEVCLAIADDIARFQYTLAGGAKKRTEEFNAYLQKGPLSQIAAWSKAAEGELAVHQINRCFSFLYISCFIVIGIMNARRKNEVSHRKIGLKNSSMKVVSEELGIYEADFYCEKTTRDYVPFYVNGGSYRAWRALLKLQRVFISIRPSTRDHASLFWRLSIGATGFNSTPTWFNFGVDKPPVIAFFRQALSSKEQDFLFPAHAFRRFYALIFFYRYEHATLLALAYQLNHDDLVQVRQYTTDALLAVRGVRLARSLSQEKSDGREAHLHELDAQLEEVGHEKLIATIESILEGGAWSGRFGHLVLKLQSKLAARADFSRLSKKASAEKITEYLEGKGFYIEPFPHSDCHAGSGLRRPGARCSNSKTGMLQKELAGPGRCRKCAYSNVKQGHVTGLELRRAALKDEFDKLPANSIARAKIETQASDLEQVIAWHRQSLSLEQEA